MGKGSIPLPPHSTTKNPQPIRAVFIGISDYQHKHFADRCVAAFATFLPSPAGGNITAENLRLLTNDKRPWRKWP